MNLIQTVKKYIQNAGQPLLRVVIIGLALVAQTYLIYTGRQSTLEGLVMLVVLVILWKSIGPVGILGLVAVLIWSPRPVPYIFIKLTGSLFEGLNLIQVGLLVWVALLVVRQVVERSYRAGRFVLPLYWQVLAFYILAGGIALYSGEAPVPGYAWRMFWQVCIVPVALYTLIVYYLKTDKDAQRILVCLLAGGMILAVVQLTNFRYIEPENEALAMINMDRLTGSFDLGPLGVVSIVTNNTALYYATLMTLAYSMALNLKSRLQQFIAMVGVVIWGWVIFRNGTRSVWVGIPVALVLISVLSIWKNPQVLRRLVIAGTVILLGFGLIGGSLQLASMVNEEIANRIQSMSSIQELSTSPTWLVRLELWRSGLSLLDQNPLGTGYVSALPPYGYPAHNEYLAQALATGIPGLAAWLIFLGLVIFRLIRATFRTSQSDVVWIFPGVLGSMVVFLISTIATDPSKRFYPYLAIWMILSVGMALVQNSPPKTEENGL